MIKGFVIAAYSTANMDWVFIALFLTLFNGIFGFMLILHLHDKACKKNAEKYLPKRPEDEPRTQAERDELEIKVRKLSNKQLAVAAAKVCIVTYLYSMPILMNFGMGIGGAIFCAICWFVMWGLVSTFFSSSTTIEKITNIQKAESVSGIFQLDNDLIRTEKHGAPLVNVMKTQADDDWRESGFYRRVRNEDRGFILGSPGSGKTSFLIAQLIDWMQSGKSFVVTDVKPEIWATLKTNGVLDKYGYTDWVFNPMNTHSHKYNIFAEASNSAELNEILSILIPTPENSDTAVFSENAKRLLRAVLLELGEAASLPAARRYINQFDTPNEIVKALRTSNREIVKNIAIDIERTLSNQNLLSSIMTSVVGAFDVLDDERALEQLASSDFKIGEVLLQPRQAVFLQFPERTKNSTERLFGAVVANMFRILQANAMQRDEVFIALDEITNSAPIPKFAETLNLIRSAKMPCFMYLQSIEMIDRKYGLNASQIFLGAADFRVCFRVSNLDTAQYFSDYIGQTETITYNYTDSSTSGTSTTMGIGNVNTSTSVSSSGVTQVTSMTNIVDPKEILQLEQGYGLMVYRGKAAIDAMPMHYIDYPCTQRPTVLEPQRGFAPYKK